MRTFIRSVLLLLISILFSACGSSGSTVEQKLDPLTGVTVRRAIEPVVLYHDDSAYAAHARNFVYMGPIEVNSMGTHAYYLWFGVWNTIRADERKSSDRDGFENVVLIVDGTPVPLELAGWTFATIGVSEPVYPKPVAGAADAFYTVTMDQIRMIASATDFELHVGTTRSVVYLPWDGSNANLESFRRFVRASD